MNDFVGFRLRIVSNLLERYSENNIRMPQSKNITSMVVGFIYRSGDKPVTQRDICEEFNMSRSSVTGLIDRMEQKEIVERISFDKDARKKRIVLTEKCRRNCKTVFQSLKELERTITDGMSEEEIKQFNRLLDKVAENITAVTCGSPHRCEDCEESDLGGRSLECRKSAYKSVKRKTSCKKEKEKIKVEKKSKS